VLAKVAERLRHRDLDTRVHTWLEMMGNDWTSAIPDDPEIAASLIEDIVPAIAETEVQETAV